MTTAALTDVQPGAVLLRAVHSPRGLLLAPEGTVLSESHLSLFASWGITEIEVEGEVVAQAQSVRPLDEEQVQALTKLLDERFSLVALQYPFMREVRRVAEQILTRRLQREQEDG